MRQVILDTETTGLDPGLGHRIVELACVEIVARRITERTFHRYLNPDRASDEGALQVHGLTADFLRDKPRFGEVAREFLEFVGGAELIIHNAPFDVAFLDAELGRLDLGPVGRHAGKVTDTLRLARELHPGKRNSLDALCERYSVDNSARTLHGALLDARLLADVYLSMTRGQESLVIEIDEPARVAGPEVVRTEGLDLRVARADADELAAHEAYLDALDMSVRGPCIWRRAEASSDAGPSSGG